MDSFAFQTIFVPHNSTVLLISRSLPSVDIIFNNLSRHVEAIALFFSENSALKSCTLRFYLCRRYKEAMPHHSECLHPLRRMLRPFATKVQSEANMGVKELVLRCINGDHTGIWKCEMDIINLVARKTTLEKLDVSDHISSRDHSFRFPGSTVRVGDGQEWQMTNEGPCLALKVCTDECQSSLIN